MRQNLHAVTLVVPDYDDAIAFYTKVLKFRLTQDIDLGDGKRWVCVTPPGSVGASLLLAKADDDEQTASIGRQTGGRVGFFLETDDFYRRRPCVRKASSLRKNLATRPMELWPSGPIHSAIGGILLSSIPES